MVPSDISTKDTLEHRKRLRERWAMGVVTGLFVLLTVAEFRLTRASQMLPLVNSIFFFGLINVNILLLLALFWLIFRNVGKLFFERKSGLMGSKLKTKLVLAFLAFSIIPTVILFIISSSYINSSFDKWFSIRIQNTLQSSLDISNVYYQNAERSAMHFATHLSKQLGKQQLRRDSRRKMASFLKSNLELLSLNGIEFYTDPIEPRVTVQAPDQAEYPRLPFDVLDKAFRNQTVSTIQHLGNGDLVRCLVPVVQGTTLVGVIVVNSYLPVSIVRRVGEISSAFEDYKGTNPLRYPIKTTYFVILIMITLVLIFVAIWLGLYLARELTDPVESLLQGVSEVAHGNLDIQIEVVGHDEISTLIRSFNQMTSHLKENRLHLTRAHSELETVLANIANGVLVVERTGRVTSCNRAAERLLGIQTERLSQAFFRDSAVELGPTLCGLIDRALQPPYSSHTAQWPLASAKTLAAVGTPILQKDGSIWGAVIVFEDISGLMKSQREMAWREVARRIAHEIKNPLTPIKLSAQRLQRRLLVQSGSEQAFIRECTDTIIQHTDELKQMVNEFSEFARLPTATPSRNDFNAVIQESVSLFNQAHPEILFVLQLEERLPPFEFDRDQIKRVLTNLLDNAVNAVLSVGTPRIKLETHYNQELSMAVLTVEDNGSGIAEALLDRVFEPYFSTKASGTGLGLAIAKRIINDHDGFIRVSSIRNQATRFLIELPTSGKTEFLKSQRESFSNATVHPHH